MSTPLFFRNIGSIQQWISIVGSFPRVWSLVRIISVSPSMAKWAELAEPTHTVHDLLAVTPAKRVRCRGSGQRFSHFFRKLGERVSQSEEPLTDLQELAR